MYITAGLAGPLLSRRLRRDRLRAPRSLCVSLGDARVSALKQNTQANNQPNKQTNKPNKQASKQASKQTNKQTNKQKDKTKEEHTNNDKKKL